MDPITQRFLSYVAFDTQSCEDSDTTPSTPKQRVFAQFLADELRTLGLSDVCMDDNAYVYATLPPTPGCEHVPAIGFIAHYDTAPDCSGADIKPRIVYNYDGSDIILSPGIVSSPSQFPELLDHLGEDLIVTDGHTLLGADDKAGIAEIVSACQHMLAHPDIPHGTIRIGFNPDEEIGRGAHKFNVKAFNCRFAYTMDGGDVGELEYENFNAASASIHITGLSVHPGNAKGKMRNAARIATELAALLPENETPEHTEGYEGFFHLTALNGSCEQAQLRYIIRDHDMERFQQRKARMEAVVETINRKYGSPIATLELSDQYYNMRQQVEPMPYIIDIARQAIAEAGMEPKVKAIRGGTDGAQLSFMGLPCPNIFAGGINLHGPYEFVPVQSLHKATQTIVNICRIATALA